MDQPQHAQKEDRMTFCNYLEGQVDLVRKLMTPRTHIVTLLIPIKNTT